jgi:hypothetical protein
MTTTAATTKPAMASLSRTGKSGCRQNGRGAHREHFQHDGPPLLLFKFFQLAMSFL